MMNRPAKSQNLYKGAPVDGSAFEGAGFSRVMRGDSFFDAIRLRADYRGPLAPDYRSGSVGFRLER